MSVLIGIALKSIVIAGLALSLLAFMKHRSASERSWVAHIGLLALVIMAFAPLVVPSWPVPAPALFGQAPAVETPVAASALATAPGVEVAHPTASPVSSAAPAARSRPTISAAAAASAFYAVPAAILLFITFVALARLIALRARAEVLVDGHWLTALARAQRRMGFKHGTALLTSNALASPISWGLMRPVILLNTRAVEAANEAEAIIAHELAHVARMDWLKLLLARVATALFWFNPLVWILAREAHQLREEAADDAVLAADIPDTDYAQLLVGVARHECPGLLLGAHGVAPSRSSLARRVARVLDGKSVRDPVGRSFGVGVLVGAAVVAAPLAALTFTPTNAGVRLRDGGTFAVAEPVSASAMPRDVPADLPHLIATGVSTSVASAAAVIAPSTRIASNSDFTAATPDGAKVDSKHGVMVARSADGASAVVYPADPSGRSRIVATAADGTTATVTVAAGQIEHMVAAREARAPRDAVDEAIELKAVGVTPEYAAAIRNASPALRNADAEDIMGLKAVGVTPQYVRDLAAVGLGNLGPDEIKEARAVGLSPEYVRGIRATGVPTTLDDLIELRAMKITPDELARARASGPLTKERIREMVVPRGQTAPRDPGDSDDR